MTIEQIISDLERKLGTFEKVYKTLDLRVKVLRLVEVLKSTRVLNKAVLHADGITVKGARERLRLYMIRYVGVTFDGIELEVVSGISEYARRIRELRKEDGYTIISKPDEDAGVNITIGQYVLVRAEPDITAAHRWHMANRIRKLKVSPQERILTYLKENVGQIVTTDELAYVGNVKDFSRRTRELRTLQGYAVATRFTGRPDLGQGEYVLENIDRIAEPHDRKIPKDVAAEVYERDKYSCRVCKWNREMWTKVDARFLELHHVKPHADKGENTAENLIVICDHCHDDVHAKRISLKGFEK